MPNTPTYSFPYPPPNGVLPDVPYWLQQAMEAVEARLTNRLPSGLHTTQATINIPVSGSVGAGAQATVTFPAGRFTSAPRVVVAKSNLPGGSGTVSVGATNISTTGCTVY